MKTVPTTYQANGYTYKLLGRNGKLVLYAQIHPHDKKPCAWELCIVRKRKAMTINGKRVEAHEYLPKNDEWGALGLTFMDEGVARHQLTIKRPTFAGRGG